MPITGIEIEQAFREYITDGGGWQLGRSKKKQHSIKSSGVIFCGRVTHKAIGVAIENSYKIIVSIDPLREIDVDGAKYEYLYKYDIFVYSMGKSWELRTNLGIQLFANILNMSPELVYTKNRNVLFVSRERKGIWEVLTRIKAGSIIWTSGLSNEEMDISKVESVSFGLFDSDICLTYTLNQEELDRIQKGKITIWLQRQVVLGEIARELMRMIHGNSKLILEVSKTPFFVRDSGT